MSRPALMLGILLAVGAPAPAAEPVDLDRLLDATREIENWAGRDGQAGERGAYGIRAATWAQHMGDKPFAMARQERWGRECARRHVAWLQRELARAGAHPSVFNLALAYNAGLGRALSGRAPERAYDYARRVENLYRTRSASDRGEHAHPAGSSHGQGPRAKAVPLFPGARNGRLAPATPTKAPATAR